MALIIVLGLPALGLAFGKVNGRPIYNSIPVFIQFWTSPKELIFHKEVNSVNKTTQLKDAEIQNKEEEEVEDPRDRKSRLEQVNKQLQKQAKEQTKLAKQLK